MTIVQTQVIIVGGGMAGLVLGTALAQAKINVAIVEAREPILDWPQDNIDPRTSALNLASQRIFKHLQLWPALTASHYGLVQRLVIWDQLGKGEICFDGADINVAPCAYIIENRVIIRALWQQLHEDPNLQPYVHFYCPRQPQQVWRSKDNVHLILDNKQSIYGQLLVGADGGCSWVREQMGVMVHHRNYQQHALICVARSEYPHQDTAWQNFLPTGPLAWLPLADKHQGAVVWSTQSMDVTRLLALETKAFSYELSNALDQRLGQVEVCSAIKAIPLIMRHAQHYVSERMVLMGDAAHSIHPLAGQGANLGLLDAACLAEVLVMAMHKQQDIGHSAVLNRYQRWRKADNTTMQIAMTTLNQLFSTRLPWLVPLRSQGLSWMHRINFLKNWLMRYAIGESSFDQFSLTRRF